ncbi:hypothetical protein FRB93_008708 [Tulasnella sp. JGI-2019a]|nr:hypothetical protein FRB93_008708 [Tulasnella sp. JGI-2019a]
MVVSSRRSAELGNYSQLKDILTEIQEMRRTTDPGSFSGSFKGLLLYAENGKKIQGYTARIGWAMNVFQVESQISNSVRLLQVADDTWRYGAMVQETHSAVIGLCDNLAGVATSSVL